MSDIMYVNERDEVIGAGPRMRALEEGIIHRVVRIFIFNSSGELLITRRSKNISLPDKWNESAAGHVDAGEEYDLASHRELEEEVGIKNIELRVIKKYYSEDLDSNGLKKRFNML